MGGELRNLCKVTSFDEWHDDDAGGSGDCLSADGIMKDRPATAALLVTASEISDNVKVLMNEF